MTAPRSPDAAARPPRAPRGIELVWVHEYDPERLVRARVDLLMRARLCDTPFCNTPAADYRTSRRCVRHLDAVPAPVADARLP